MFINFKVCSYLVKMTHLKDVTHDNKKHKWNYRSGSKNWFSQESAGPNKKETNFDHGKKWIKLKSFFLFFQAALFTWEWCLEHSSGEECLTSWDADRSSSSACPPMAFLPSCRRLSRDMVYSFSAVLLQVLGKLMNRFFPILKW